MSDRDIDALTRWQASTPGQTEYLIWQLEDTIDRLTDLAQSRDGAREVRNNFECIRRSLRKHYDLYADHQPALIAAE